MKCSLHNTRDKYLQNIQYKEYQNTLNKLHYYNYIYSAYKKKTICYKKNVADSFSVSRLTDLLFDYGNITILFTYMIGVQL